MRYLAWMGAGLLAAMAGAVALGVAIDPYRAYGSPAVAGWTEKKVRIYQQALAAKRWQILRLRPRTLLLGNSRVEAGLDPQSPLWPESARPVFNAGLAGRGLPAALEMFRAGIAAGNLKQIYVAADFTDFLPRLEGPARPIPSMEQSAGRWRGLRDLAEATLTLDALSDAAVTVLAQRIRAMPDMLADGRNPMHEYDIEVRQFGFGRLFAHKAIALAAQLRSLGPSDFTHTEIDEFAALRRLLLEADAAGVGVTVFIHPYHVTYLQALRAHGLWPSFEAWKMAVVSVLQATAPSARLLDFSGCWEMTEESPPPQGDTQSRMRYYWEASHYTTAAGERVIAGLTGQEVGGQGVGQRVEGRLLRPETISGALDAIRRECGWPAVLSP